MKNRMWSACAGAIATLALVLPGSQAVAQQKAEMGRLAVERVVAALQDGGGVPEPTVVRLPTSLSVRESTGPVRPAR